MAVVSDIYLPAVEPRWINGYKASLLLVSPSGMAGQWFYQLALLDKYGEAPGFGPRHVSTEGRLFGIFTDVEKAFDYAEKLTLLADSQLHGHSERVN